MKVRITVRGRTYTVRSDEDDVDLQSVAKYVDEKMSEVSGRASASVDDYTIAMLTCLNIASEFERYRAEVDGRLKKVEQEVVAADMLLRSAAGESAG